MNVRCRVVSEIYFEYESQFDTLRSRLFETISIAGNPKNSKPKPTDILLCELSLILEHANDIRMMPVNEGKKEKRRQIELDLASLRNLYNN